MAFEEIKSKGGMGKIMRKFFAIQKHINKI